MFGYNFLANQRGVEMEGLSLPNDFLLSEQNHIVAAPVTDEIAFNSLDTEASHLGSGSGLPRFNSLDFLFSSIVEDLPEDVGAELYNDNQTVSSVQQDILLAESVSIATDYLLNYKDTPDFLDGMKNSFGEDILIDEAINAVDSLFKEESSPDIEIVEIDNSFRASF